MSPTSTRRVSAVGALLLTVLVPTTAAHGEEPTCEDGASPYISEPPAALDRLGVPRTWTLSEGEGVTVAVVDSGVEADNEHLAGAVEPGTTFVGGERGGRVDSYGLGTAVAGVIAARRVPGSGLAGMAPKATILPVRTYAQVPSSPEEQVPHPPGAFETADGIRWASEHGADVINVSFATPPDDPDLRLLDAAVSDAHRRGVLVVASAGATAGTSLTQPQYPAGSEHALGVAATNQLDVVDDWSAHGPHVDVVAPGSNVLVTFFGNGDCYDATDHADPALATAYVSGLAAQLVARYPEESPDEIAYRIQAAAERPERSERSPAEGWGLIRPLIALTMSLDAQRAGPAVPGVGEYTRVSTGRPTEVQRLVDEPDPDAHSRSLAVMWGMVLGGAAAGALILRPLLGRRLRER